MGHMPPKDDNWFSGEVEGVKEILDNIMVCGPHSHSIEAVYLDIKMSCGEVNLEKNI